MRQSVIKRNRTILMSIAIDCSSFGFLSADQFGLCTYQVAGDAVEITAYPTDATGSVIIPAEIDGKPVTSLGTYAFVACGVLTDVTLPEGITTLSDGTFADCSDLTSITLPASLTFHATSPEITYAVETSVNLRTWVTAGVALSELGPDNTRAATVDRTSPVQFLRLVVTHWPPYDSTPSSPTQKDPP